MTVSTPDASLLGKIANYTEILDKDPHSTVFVPLSDSFRQMGLLEDALEVVKKGVQDLPRFSPGLVMLGRIQFEMGDVEGAIASLEAAHEMDPQSLSAIKGLARVLAQKGDKGRARQLLEEAVRLNPEDSGAGRMLASLPPQAFTAASNPVERPDDPIATPTIAEIYLKQGLPHRALKVYRDLLKANPQNHELKGKLTELERMLQAGAGAPAVEVGTPAEPPAAAPPAPLGNPSAVAPTSGKPASPVADRHLATLDRWLVAIRRRRAHVR